MERSKVKAIQNDALAALKAVAEKHGLVVNAAGGKFGHASATLKFEFAQMVGGVVVDQCAEDFKVLASTYGLKPEHLGKAFMFNGTVYTVAGAKPASYKRPIIGARRHDGKRFKFSAQAVASGLRIEGSL